VNKNSNIKLKNLYINDFFLFYKNEYEIKNLDEANVIINSFNISSIIIDYLLDILHKKIKKEKIEFKKNLDIKIKVKDKNIKINEIKFSAMIFRVIFHFLIRARNNNIPTSEIKNNKIIILKALDELESLNININNIKNKVLITETIKWDIKFLFGDYFKTIK